MAHRYFFNAHVPFRTENEMRKFPSRCYSTVNYMKPHHHHHHCKYLRNDRMAYSQTSNNQIKRNNSIAATYVPKYFFSLFNYESPRNNKNVSETSSYICHRDSPPEKKNHPDHLSYAEAMVALACFQEPFFPTLENLNHNMAHVLDFPNVVVDVYSENLVNWRYLIRYEIGAAKFPSSLLYSGRTIILLNESSPSE